MSKRGQGATEYLLMLAAVLVIVAIAVYYITAAAPTAMIAGEAVVGPDNTVQFTPATTMVPETIPQAEWEWEVRRGGVDIASGTGSAVGEDLVRGETVLLVEAGETFESGDVVYIKYKDTWHEAATVA
jgi:hypothetical protein